MTWSRSYGRKSRVLGDRDDVDVVAHQLAACDRMAAEDGVMLGPADRIAEVGSGESLDARPRFSALLTDLLSNPPPSVGRLYVTEIPRLTRADMEEAGKVLRILREAGVLLRLPGRTFDLRRPEDEMFVSWLAVQSRHEVQQYKQRVNIKVDELLAQGAVRNGAAPFGYRWVKGDWDERTRRRSPGRLEADPLHFPTLVACCRDVLHTSVHALANRYSIPMINLYNSLKNPTICGYPSIHKQQAGPLPRDQWRMAGRQNDTYPHACTRAEWEAIQTALSERARRRERTQTPQAWCRDVVTFTGLEGEVYLSSVRWGQGEGRTSRLIYALREHSQSTRWLAYIERDRVHAAAETALFALFADPARVATLVESYLEQTGAATIAESVEAEMEREIAQQERRYQTAVDAEFDAVEPLRSALAIRRRRLESEIERLKRRLVLEREQEGQESALRQMVADLPSVAAHFKEGWPLWQEPARRLLVRGTIEQIRVRCERVGKLLRVREVEEVVLQPWFLDSPCVNRFTMRKTQGEFRSLVFVVKRAR